MKVHCLSICVCGKDDRRYAILCNVKNIYLFAYFGVSLETFTIIFYYHAVMNTFIQWQETISDTYLTDTSSCFPFIEPNISLLPQGGLATIQSNALFLLAKLPRLAGLASRFFLLYFFFFFFVYLRKVPSFDMFHP